MERKYVAFISYRHAPLDSAVAKALHTAIEQYRVPRDVSPGRRRLGLVFRDREELHAASDLSQKISQALENSEYLIVVCSENTKDSPWVSREIDQFLLTHDRSHVLTVLASGEPKDVFPDALTHAVDASGNVVEIEPLAVDLRSNTPAGMRRTLRRELVRLAAPILGCPLDALVLREQKRKLRRFVAVAGVVLAVALGFSATVIAKNRQIQNKNDQLAQKNDELAAQKAQIQLRESELLAANAVESLSRGDYWTAARSAAAALPRTEDPDRPYLAQAEAALMAATNLFEPDDQDYVLQTVEIAQTTAVTDLVIHSDGSKFLCIDGYGTVCCYSADTSQLLWATQITDPDPSSLSCVQQVFFTRNGELAVACYADVLQAWELETGSPAWRHELMDWEADSLYYHPETDVFVYVTSLLVNPKTYKYCLRSVSGADGSLLQTVQLFEEQTYDFYSGYHSQPLDGAFSPDGRYFAGICTDPLDRPHCFTVDLQTAQASRMLLSDREVQYDYAATGLHFREGSRELLFAAKGYCASGEISAVSIDLQEQVVRWQTDLDSNDLLQFAPQCHSILFQDHLILSLDKQLICLDPETGEGLSTKALSGRTTLLQSINERQFGVATEDGLYSIGWLSDSGITLTTDPFFGASAFVGDHSRLWIWGQGVVQMYSDNGGFMLGLSNLAEPGYIVLLPEARENVICVLKPVLPDSFLEEQTIALPCRELSANYAATGKAAGGTLIAGPLDRRIDTLKYAYGYALIDMATGTLRQYIELESSDGDAVYFLSDGSSYLAGGPSEGALELRTLDGESTTLHIYQDKMQATRDNVLVARKLESTYLADGTLLTVACNAMDLTYWRNGILTDTLALPESLTKLPEDYHFCSRGLTLCANGWAFMATWVEDLSIPLAHTAALNTADGTWVTLSGEGLLANPGSFCMAQDAPLLAVADAEGNLRIFDLISGTEQNRFRALVPASSIRSAAFFGEGKYLAVATEDNGLFLFDVRTGGLLCQTSLEADYDSLRIFTDSQNQRLYITRNTVSSYSDGFVMDMRSWTELSRIQGIIHFDPNSGLLYRFHNPTLGIASMTCSTVPTAMELADLVLAQ